MLPSPSEIQYFLEVAQTGNISRAAERLGITQPSLSLAVRRLEDNIGGKLLIRSKTGVTLTKMGRQFQTKARSLLQDWESLKSEMTRNEDEVRGHFTMGLHPSVALYTLPHFFAKMMKNFPLLEFSLKHDLSRRITEHVISFKLDFGIVVNPVEHPDLVIREICKDVVTFWVAGKIAPANKTNLIFDPDLTQSQSLLRKLKKLDFEFTRKTESGNLEVITHLTSSGAGVGILPTRVATNLKALRLQKLHPKAPQFLDRICLIYRADVPKNIANRKIIEEIMAGLKEL